MQVRRTYESLRKQRLDGFMEGFNAISLKLKEMYQVSKLNQTDQMMSPEASFQCPDASSCATTAVSWYEPVPPASGQRLCFMHAPGFAVGSWTACLCRVVMGAKDSQALAVCLPCR